MSPPSYTSFYSAQTMFLHKRYGLSVLGKKLLKAYDDYYFGRLSEADLARMMRFSHGLKRAATETITRCAEVMEKEPEERKRCVEIINACTKMLGLCDTASEMEAFPFRKLPFEIRRMIYKEYTSKTISRSLRGFQLGYQYDPCICPGLAAPRHPSDLKPVNLALARTAKWIRQEYMDMIMTDYRLHFPCCCVLLHHLKQNHCLIPLLRSVRVHWVGPKAPEAFKLLTRCRNLSRLELVISKSTTSHLNDRESKMRSAFRVQKPPRLWDALGLDELLEIRGIWEVEVLHIQARQGLRRTDDEKQMLLRLLEEKLNQPRHDVGVFTS